jgi:hypothetical protein
LFLSTLFLGGCADPMMLDQSVYEDLSAKLQQEEAFVRLYGTFWFTENFPALHSWYVYKRASDDELVRWEVYPGFHGEYGVVRKNGLPSIIDFGGGVWILGELTGSDAEAVIDVLETQSPQYPYQNMFHLVIGPNCNTYARWILQQAHWDIELPEAAIGRDYPLPPSDGGDNE